MDLMETDRFNEMKELFHKALDQSEDHLHMIYMIWLKTKNEDAAKYLEKIGHYSYMKETGHKGWGN